MKNVLLAAALGALLFASAKARADSSTFTGAAKDAWLTGKIEAAFVLNAHLNPFRIDTDVDNGVVHLTGTVRDDIDRDLAVELVRGLDGVVEVKNDIKLDRASAEKTIAERQSAETRDFGSWVDDATTTAMVKSKLIGNANIAAGKINVDTRDDIVTLSGRVGSGKEKELAEQIAANVSDVEDVKNNLVVDAQ
ncbi:MAG TPA: BON domain-containing protein [Gammaproteobacteria bacterium]|nr:BON domain-containing protein [Gammaproteobacteria bacterium]